jgi:type I restriction enzyme R subunit
LGPNAAYRDGGEGGTGDGRPERVVYGRFLDPEARKAFRGLQGNRGFVGAPVPFSRIAGSRLAQLYASVLNAYADKVGFLSDLAADQVGRAQGSV